MATITIYQSPSDMEGPDEEAELVRRIHKYGASGGAQYYRLEKWVVRFTRDGREGERLVHEDQIPEHMRVEHCEGDSTRSTFLPPYS